MVATSPSGKAADTRGLLPIIVKGAICLVLLSALVLSCFVVDVRLHTSNLLTWINSNPVKGFFVFQVLYAVGTVCLLPGLILSLGAGAVFGLPLGLLAVWMGATIGETLAFLLGRFLFREFVAEQTAKHEWWQAVEHAIEHEGWKIVLLLRLTPLVPFNLLNYALACTAVRFWDYTWASSVGVLPGMLPSLSDTLLLPWRQAFFIYLGSLAQNLVDLASSKTAPRMDTVTTIVTAAVSGLMITAVAFLTGSYAKRAIEQKLASGSRQAAAAAEELKELVNDKDSEHLVPVALDRGGLSARTQIAREEDAV